MSRITRISFVALLFGAGIALAGCQTNDSSHSHSALVPGEKGLTCSKCQTTWVQVADRSGKSGKVMGYTTEKKDVCPDCTDAVNNFFATGKLQHGCKTCGDAMKVCESH